MAICNLYCQCGSKLGTLDMSKSEEYIANNDQNITEGRITVKFCDECGSTIARTAYDSGWNACVENNKKKIVLPT